MTILVNWQLMVVTAFALGVAWLLGRGRAVARMCAMTGIAVTLEGVNTGNIIMAAGGVLILACTCWAFWELRGSGQRRTGGGR